VARWTWHRSGWSSQLGVLDFAGGTPVHITAGTTVAAFALFYDFETSNLSLMKYSITLLRRTGERIAHDLEIIWVILKGCFKILKVLIKGGKWKKPKPGKYVVGPTEDAEHFEPYNNTYLVLGTALLWFGWAGMRFPSILDGTTLGLTDGLLKGFNGGSALGANLRAVSAWLSTHVAACAGGVVGILWQWNEKLQDAGKRDFGRMSPAARYADLTVISFCDGAIAGLVAITPGSGFVGPSLMQTLLS
jgi:ammonium transporter, Amt family